MIDILHRFNQPIIKDMHESFDFFKLFLLVSIELSNNRRVNFNTLWKMELQ
jgi:hypothetical protein